MANAVQAAPEKKAVKEIEVEGEKVFEGSNEHLVLSQEFDIGKKYMFQLANPNMEREILPYLVEGNRAIPLKHKKFRPYNNIVMTSQIVWKGRRRMLRYYDGCDSIFVDKQPKEKDVVDQYISQTTRRSFNDGKWGCHGYERMLLLYMSICGWNGESPFRTQTATMVFIPLDASKTASAELSKLDKQEEALKLAKEASETKMLIHADYLQIPMKDYDSDNDRTPVEIRIDYRKAALANAESFIESYGNKSLEVKYYIKKALASGLINSKFNPNKATWKGSNTVICDISGLRSFEAIEQAVFEFSQSEAGEEFVIQLKALNEQ